MQHTWFHKSYQIQDGLKPGSKHFQYFYVVLEGEQKKSNYCVWIEDDILSRFATKGDFDSIVSSHREKWNDWVRGKIDGGDFGNKVLKIDKEGEHEIELSEMSTHLSP